MTSERLAINAADLADVDEYQLREACKKARRDLKWFPKVKEIRDIAKSIPPNTVTVSSCSGGCELCDGNRWILRDGRAAVCPNWRMVKIPIDSARKIDDVVDGESIIRYALPAKEVKQLPSSDEERKEFFEALKSAAQKINLNNAPTAVFTRGKQ